MRLFFCQCIKRQLTKVSVTIHCYLQIPLYTFNSFDLRDIIQLMIPVVKKKTLFWGKSHFDKLCILYNVYVYCITF